MQSWCQGNITSRTTQMRKRRKARFQFILGLFSDFPMLSYTTVGINDQSWYQRNVISWATQMGSGNIEWVYFSLIIRQFLRLFTALTLNGGNKRSKLVRKIHNFTNHTNEMRKQKNACFSFILGQFFTLFTAFTHNTRNYKKEIGVKGT